MIASVLKTWDFFDDEVFSTYSRAATLLIKERDLPKLGVLTACVTFESHNGSSLNEGSSSMSEFSVVFSFSLAIKSLISCLLKTIRRGFLGFGSLLRTSNYWAEDFCNSLSCLMTSLK